MSSHPNATVAGGTTGAAAVIIYLAHLLGANIPTELAVLAAGALTTAVLAVGRDGIRGLIRRIWRGSGPRT